MDSTLLFGKEIVRCNDAGYNPVLLESFGADCEKVFVPRYEEIRFGFLAQTEVMIVVGVAR